MGGPGPPTQEITVCLPDWIGIDSFLIMYKREEHLGARVATYIFHVVDFNDNMQSKTYISIQAYARNETNI